MPPVPPAPPAPCSRSRALALLGTLAVVSVVAVHLGLRLTEAQGGRREAEARTAVREASLRAEQRARFEAEVEAEAQALALSQRLTSQQELLARESGARAASEEQAAALLDDARAELLPLGRLETLERMARAVLGPLEGRAAAAPQGGPAGARARALTLLGEVLLRRGKPEEAEEPLRDALTLARERLEAEPGRSEAVVALSAALHRVADVRQERGDGPGASELEQEALVLLRALNDRDPAEPRWLGLLGETLADAASALAAGGRLPEARAHAEEAVVVLTALGAREPASPAWGPLEARARGVCGDIRLQAGEPAEALGAYRAALARLAPAADAPDGGAALAAQRADLLLRLGAAAGKAERTEDALAALRDALDAAVVGVERGPAALEAFERLAHICDALSAALEAAEQPDDALAGRRQAVLVWKRVADLDGGSPERHAEVVHALLRLGDLLVRHGALAEGLTAFEEGAERTRALGDDAAATGGSDLVDSLDRSAATLLALGRRAQALDTWRAALAVMEPLAKKTPENSFWQADLARLWWHLGSALAADDDDRPEGLRALKRAQRLLAGLGAARRVPAFAATWPGDVAGALRSAQGEASR